MVLCRIPMGETIKWRTEKVVMTYKNTTSMHNRQILVLEDKHGSTYGVKISDMCSDPICGSREG